MAGRPRKPLALHVAEGTYRKDRHGPPPKANTPGKIKRPRGLAGDARKFWDDVLARLVESGVLQTTDLPAAQLLCDLWAKLQTTSELFDADPTDTSLRCSVTAFSAEFCRLAGRFGLTPADRAKLGASDHGEAGDFERQYFG